MEIGLPLLHDLDLGLEAQAVSELMLQLAHAVETAGGKKGERPRNAAARRIRMALEKGSVNVGDLLLHIAHSDRDSVAAAATDSLHLDPGLVWTLAQNALKPALRAWCRQLTHLAGGFPWHRGYCFICGAGATLGELQENNLVKHLRCGHCGADWPFPRLKCIYCGNEDHSTLGYFYQGNQNEKHRVEVCEKCKGYVKIITTFSPTPPEMLQVEDLSTLHLDYVAQEKGYIRVVIQ
jgi:FdhE protein